MEILMLNQGEFESMSSFSRGLDLKLSEVTEVQSSFYIKLLAKAKTTKRDCGYGCMINTRSMFWRIIQQDKLDLNQAQAHNCISVCIVRTWHEICASFLTFTVIFC